MKTELEKFLNRARILHSIDYRELVEAGAGLGHAEWEWFRRAPIDFLLHADDEVGRLVWSIVEKRGG